MGLFSNLFLSPKMKILKESLDFNIGPYSLNKSISGIQGLKEVSKEEYDIFERTFKNEKIYNGIPIKYEGHEWKVTIATVNNTIYKINIYLFTNNSNDFNNISEDMLSFIEQNIGKADKGRYGNHQWISTAGNIILQAYNTEEGFYVGIFFTSSSVRNFESL